MSKQPYYELHFIGQTAELHMPTTLWSQKIAVPALTKECVVAAFQNCIKEHGQAPSYKVYGLDPSKPNVARTLK